MYIRFSVHSLYKILEIWYFLLFGTFCLFLATFDEGLPDFCLVLKRWKVSSMLLFHFVLLAINWIASHPKYWNLEILTNVFNFLELHHLEEAVFVKQRETTLLLDKLGFLYKVNNKSKTSGKIWWKCHKYNKFPKCLAKAITDGPSVVSWHGDHNHLVPIMDYYRL